MPKRRQDKVRLGLALVASGCVTGAVLSQPRNALAGAAAEAGRRHDEMLIASAAICRKIAPQEPGMELSVVPVTADPRNHFVVQCNSVTPNGIATLTWDARTRRVCKANTGLRFWLHHGRPMRDPQTLLSARFWLKTLQMVPDPDAWRPVALERSGYIATVKFADNDRLIRIRIDGCTGDLGSADWLKERP